MATNKFIRTAYTEHQRIQEQLRLRETEFVSKRIAAQSSTIDPNLALMQTQYNALSSKYTDLLGELERTKEQLKLREGELIRKTAEQAAANIKPQEIANTAARVEALRGKEQTLAINAQNILERLIRVRRSMEQLERLSAEGAGGRRLPIALQ